MTREQFLFENRREAGERLASRLAEELDGADGWLVLSIPKGGVVVGERVAWVLGLEHQVLVAKKVGAPENPELAIGAMGPDGIVVWNEALLERGRYAKGVLDEQVEKVWMKIGEYKRKFGADDLDLTDKRVILVDDGVATGGTLLAAVEWLRKEGFGVLGAWQNKARVQGGGFEWRGQSSLPNNGSERLVVAVPVCSREAFEKLVRVADRVVCLHVVDDMVAVGQYYREFGQVSEEEVRRLLGIGRS